MDSSYAASSRTREDRVLVQPLLDLRERNDPKAPPADDSKLRLNMTLEGGLAHPHCLGSLGNRQTEARR